MIITNQNQVLWEENNYTEQQTNYSNKSESEINAITSDTKTSSTPIDWKSITDPKLRRKAYYEANKDKIKACSKAWGESHPDEMKAYKKAYHLNNRDKRLADMKVYNKEYKSKLSKAELHAQQKTYRNANKPLLNAKSKAYNATHKDKINSYRKRKYKTNIQFRLSKVLRGRLFRALKRNQKTGSAVRDLGCSILEFKTYLESKFQSGMTWDNQGEWHIDHIKPLASFDLTNRDQFLIACHYTNLQPLWATENIVKSDNWTA